MDYEITEVSGVKDDVYQGKAGVRFKVAGVEHSLSTLTNEKQKYVVGAVVHGKITSKFKDGKTFYNFNEESKATHQTVETGFKPTGDLLRVERKLDAIITEIQLLRGVYGEIKGVLGDILSKVDKVDTAPF
jgi:hypothetical protein